MIVEMWTYLIKGLTPIFILLFIFKLLGLLLSTLKQLLKALISSLNRPKKSDYEERENEIKRLEQAVRHEKAKASYSSRVQQADSLYWKNQKENDKY